MPPDNVIPLPEPQDDLQRQALSWVVRLNSGEATQGDRQAFTLWIEQNTEHRQAFFAARRLWRDIGYVDLTQAATASQADSDKRSRTGASTSRARSAYALAALGLLTVCLLASYPLVPYFIADYVTSVGEVKTLHLSDGSTVYLNTDSMIAENFSENKRNLELLAGEAEFAVAHDMKRPFVVTAGTGRTRALGTRFIVRYANDTVRVSVLENTVEITSETQAPVTLNSGYRLEYGRQGLLNVSKAPSNSEANAWRYGKLKFNARPLKEVVAEIDRYVAGKIVLANDRFAAHQVSGVFEIENLDRAIPVIAKSLQLKTVGIDDLLVVIY
ncbi:MAG: FecR family protein [Methylococcales bacterium]